MYHTILDEIFHSYPMYHRIGNKAYKEGMDNVLQLIDLLEHPEKNFKTIHVAGSNGKGSVSHLLASFFQEAGYCTGLFTSPHLVDFRERIKVNGTEISEKEVIDFFQQYHQKIKEIAPSFFEITVGLAFDYFRKKKVDIAIIEVGLGGRLDSTNFITPDLSIITNISLEHTQMLGDSIEKIALEKAGIIKNNIPVLIGEFQEDSFPIFSTTASSKNSPLFTTEKISIVKNEKQDTISIFNEQSLIVANIHSPFIPDYQLKNIKTFTVASLLLCKKYNLPTSLIGKGIENVIKNVNLKGRWQILRDTPLTICDVAHNLACFQQILPQIEKNKYNHLHFILGFVNDKELDSIFSLLPKKSVTYYTCQAKIERALAIDKLNLLMEEYQLPFIQGNSVIDAYTLALQNANCNDIIFISGSNFVVGELLKNI